MLYNITFKRYDESEHLVPYIPYTAASDEDRTTKRICFADSVEHCMTVIGPCERDLYTGCHVIVRSVDETNLDQSKLVTPQKLFESGRVPDALENQEYWYLDELDVTREIFKVEDFVYEHQIAFSCIKRDDLKDVMEKHSVIMRRNETVEQAYNRTLDLLYKTGSYEEADIFEEEVNSLSWAQGLKVSNLIMERIG